MENLDNYAQFPYNNEISCLSNYKLGRYCAKENTPLVILLFKNRTQI